MNPRRLALGPESAIASQFRCATGESPLWHPADQAFYWVDIPAATIHRFRPADGAMAQWRLPEVVGCIARRSGAGELIAACERSIFAVDLDDDAGVRLRRLASFDMPLAGMRFNDGRCDRQGRFWVGTHLTGPQRRAVGEMLRLDGRGLQRTGIDGLAVPNGLAFSPDGRTMYLSDAAAESRTVWAFDYDIDEGVPSNRRVFIDMARYGGRPDGAAMDADGCYWICAIDAGCVLRFTPSGRLDTTLDLPTRTPTMPAFGGAAMSTLLLTSLARKTENDDWAGAVFLSEMPVRGLTDAFFRDN